MRQWLWRLGSYVPLSVWALSLVLPVAYSIWTLRHATSVDLEPLQQQTALATASVVELRRQLESLHARQSGEDRTEVASESLLELLLRHRCGLSKGFEFNLAGVRATLVFNGSSLESLCALRMVWQFPGGVQQLRRDSTGHASFSWEGTQQ